MKRFLSTACASFVALTFLGGGVGVANADSHMKEGGGDTKVSVVDANKATENLRSAVTKLREASVLLLKNKESAESQKAFRAAQQAVIDAQRAMAALPIELLIPDYTKVREAKEWPVIAARLDKASIDLEEAVNAVAKSSPGERRNDAIRAMYDALEKVNEAIGAIPEDSMGKN